MHTLSDLDILKLLIDFMTDIIDHLLTVMSIRISLSEWQKYMSFINVVSVFTNTFILFTAGEDLHNLLPESISHMFHSWLGR
jgi:hypothetical protein